jgi:hypothetical protein
MLAAAVLLVVTLYGTLASGHGFLYDDRELILEEPRPHGFSDLARAFAEPYYGALPYYRPLTRISYLVEKELFGDVPAPFLLTNAALMGALTLAAYALLIRPRFGIGPRPALAAALLFALHPVASSCVVPIAGRDTLLPVTLMISSVPTIGQSSQVEPRLWSRSNDPALEVIRELACAQYGIA